jgi:hypothetical protein
VKRNESPAGEAGTEEEDEEDPSGAVIRNKEGGE